MSNLTRSDTKLTRTTTQVLGVSQSAPQILQNGPPLDKYQEIAQKRPIIRLKSIVEENSKKNDDEDDDDEAAPAAMTEDSSVKKKSKTPRRLERHPESAVMNKIMFEQQAVLIKPNIDASDKELHMRNKFNHQSKNMEQFI